MKLYELQVGQRFEFDGRHHNVIFEVTVKSLTSIRYRDVATGQLRHTASTRRTFRMDVLSVTSDRLIPLSDQDLETIQSALHIALQVSAEEGGSESERSEINRVYLKIKNR